MFLVVRTFIYLIISFLLLFKTKKWNIYTFTDTHWRLDTNRKQQYAKAYVCYWKYIQYIKPYNIFFVMENNDSFITDNNVKLPTPALSGDSYGGDKVRIQIQWRLNFERF